MVHGVADGQFTQKINELNKFDAILAGPGLTVSPQTKELILQLIAVDDVPLVLDAGALSVFAHDAEILATSRRPLIITPHPGEAARLLACMPADVQADRLRAANDLVTLTGAVTVLKGAGTLIADLNGPCSINLTGNPGMAKGGSGDVLAGLLTGLLGQKISLTDAAKLAVYLHGCAGDEAAWGSSQAGMKAGDIINAIPMAFRRVVTR
jgi:NAD(P)H-hydrate epimerase